MALVSPGVQLTVTDQSQYVPAGVGTVPLVVLATAQDKTVNGSIASGTTKANAGVLQVFGSQRELVNALGYPTFKQSSAGTPLHGNEQNEYGLMASYSSLGLGNRLYAIRADIDLNQLTSTTVRPKGEVADSTYWLDLANTTWGIFEWSADTQTFTSKAPIVITSTNDTANTAVTTDGLTLYFDAPKPTIGQIGSYAAVATHTDNRIYYKRYDNRWTLVGSNDWDKAIPTVISANTNPTLTSGLGITINTTTNVIITGTTVSAANLAINSAAIPGVTSREVNGKLYLYATKSSKSDGTTVPADGKLKIGAGTIATQLGLTAGTYNRPVVQYGNYAQVPAWTTNDATSRPNGAVWLKTGATGGGSNFVFKKYNATTATWTSQTSTSFPSEEVALYKLDPVGGGYNIGVGTIFLQEDPDPTQEGTSLQLAGFMPMVRTVQGVVTAVGNNTSPSFTGGDQFYLNVTVPGQPTLDTYTITVGTSGTVHAEDFVSAILAANIPNVTAAVTGTGAISMTHQLGGAIQMVQIGSRNVPGQAGFVDGVANVHTHNTAEPVNTVITGFSQLTNPNGSAYTYSFSQPYADPTNGTLWYYGDATTIDVMINDGTAWRGYQKITDIRGYNLAQTNPTGVIVSASQPATQTDNTALVPGDLWLDTSDLENWPKLSRYTGSTWIAIDNTDQVSTSGVLFADARWDLDGTTDPISGSLPSITSLLTSDYTDLDIPDARLYPRGMLLVNTRRSGYNVKRFVSDYFNSMTFDGMLPDMTSTWVSASGNKNNGAMYAGHNAQRAIIVEAMRAAIDGNSQIREEQFIFNLIVAPGYPEVISNMVALNNDRANTAFIIGDTPLTLSTNVTELTNWSNDTNGDGLPTNDPYLGVYYPSGLTNDVQGNPIVVPPSHIALRTFLHNDNVSYQWFAPAGTRRGLVDNATDLGYVDVATGEFVRTGVSQSLRDSLYQININPITILTGTGLVVWGQKTRNPTSSSLDRVNVARLVNYIRTILGKAGNAFLFEPNDKITRDQIKQIIESALNDLVAKRGIYDYLVVCDTSNNTPDRIARNELYVDIAIEPMKDVEFIYIPIRLLNPGDIGNLGK
jgi:Phage tail sheath C-terminal domain